MVTVAKVLEALTAIAPLSLAEPWDNVGLLLGDQQAAVKTIGIALDVVPETLEAAAREGVDCLITHHPLLFAAQKKFVADQWPDRAVLELMRRSVALVAMHTNLDKAAGGVNDCLAAGLQLMQVRPLATEPTPMRKLVVFVPEAHTEQVAEAIGAAGAGQLGQYRDCSFRTNGVGVFRPLDGAKPFLGAHGRLEQVAEVRLEALVPETVVAAVQAAMLAAHPYEEPAYDWLPLLNDFRQPGLGRLGEWPDAVTGRQAVERVRVAFPGRALRFADAGRPVRTIALCGGSGSDLWRTAQRAGADLLVTADCKYHEAQQACLAGMSLIDLGHDDSERPVLAMLAAQLAARLDVANGVRIVVLAQASLWQSE